MMTLYSSHSIDLQPYYTPDIASPVLDATVSTDTCTSEVLEYHLLCIPYGVIADY